MNDSQDSPVEAALKANSIDLLRYFERRTDRDMAADLVAETMLAAWKREQDSPDGAEATRMWLFGIARNVLNNAERGQRRRHRLASKLKSMLRPEESSQAADEGAEVRDAVRRLEPELGELVRLVHWDGFSIADAGQVLGLPPSTARGHYQRAKEQLRAALGGDSSQSHQHCPATLPRWTCAPLLVLGTRLARHERAADATLRSWRWDFDATGSWCAGEPTIYGQGLTSVNRIEALTWKMHSVIMEYFKFMISNVSESLSHG